MKRLLVTGHDGFVGSTLLRWLADPACGWHGDLEPVVPEPGFDLRDEAAVRALALRARPDWVVHLAAQSLVPASFDDPVGTIDVNLLGTVRLLRALDDAGFAGRLLYASSADVYGRVPADAVPIAERHPPQPANPYAISKLAAEMICRQWRFRAGASVVVARPFNHVGPGQRADFALSSFARSIAAVRAGLSAPRIEVGNLDVTRDFTHVLDICDGYLALLARGRDRETYNLCSGIERRLRDVLQGMIERSGCRAEAVVVPERFRPVDQPRACGDPSLAAGHAGWRAVRALEPALDAMVDYWESELNK